MLTMKVTSTRDVPLDVLRELKQQLTPEFDLDVDTQVDLRSAEPPSWITFIAQSPGWLQALAAYAALYVAEIVKEAGKETWNNRGRAFAALRNSTDHVKRFASAIAKTLARLRPTTRAAVGLPIPDDIYTTQLYLSSRDEDEIAVELAMFVHHLPALIALLHAEGVASGRASGWVGLELLIDGSLEVTWFDKHTLERARRVIPLDNAP